MKNILATLILVFTIQCGYGQDIISTKDNKQLNVKIIEQTDKFVRYKMNDYEDGPLLNLKTKRISRIEYKNGYVDLLGNQNPRKNKPLGLSAGYGAEITGGGGFFSATVDYFVVPQVDLEMSLGASDFSGGVYFSAGTRFHVNSSSSENKLTPFTGVLLGTYYGDEFTQIPAGISYISNSGFNGSVSINEMISFNGWQLTFLELRLGWKFKL
jgi:hypothetical protein